MNISKQLFILIFCNTLIGVCLTDQTVCYFGSWAVYRPPLGTFDVEDIDPFLCTHLIFSFAGVSNHTWQITVLDPYNELCPPDGSHCAYDRFVALKQQNPNLVITLAVGGWTQRSEQFSAMAADPAKRSIFVNSTVELLLAHGFDGLDVDWEYPASENRGGQPEDKVNYISLLKDLRQSFNSFNPPLRLTAAVPAGKDKIDVGYDVPAMIEYLDAFHLMAYDFHGSWENFTHHNAPLCGYPGDSGVDMFYRVDYSINYYLEQGVPNNMLILGIAVYGRCWTLDDVNNDHGMKAPAHNPSPAGPYTQLPGTLTNNEICERKRDHVCIDVLDPDLNEPYFYCDDGVWCGYDDLDSVYKKARYAKNLGLGGALVWTIDESDFIPECGSLAFPAANKINEALALAADETPFQCLPAGWGD